MELFIIIGALIAFGIFVLVRFLKNCDKAQDGAQYQELRDLVATALPGESGLQVAYGFLEDVEYRGKVTLTTYYWYALAFRSDCLWIAPLGFEKMTNEMGLTAPMLLVRPEELGMVTANASKKKDILFLELYREDRSQPVNCHVEATNRRSSRFHRANIYQQEACAVLCEQMERWAQRVNPAHTELQAAWKVEDKYKKRVDPVPIIAMGGVGIVLGLIFGPFGLLLVLIVLLKIRAAKKAGATLPKRCMVLAILTIAASLLNITLIALWIFRIV